MKEQQKSYNSWYFLGVVVLIYIFLMMADFDMAHASMLFTIKILSRVIPAFLLVFLLMVVINMFVQAKHVQDYVGKGSGVKGWLFAIISGIISTGPIYMWYPILKQAKANGARTALISTFLYNRSIKLPLIPLLISYFGFKYMVILTAVIIISSPLQGWLVEKMAK